MARDRTFELGPPETAVLAAQGQGPDLAWEPSELAKLVPDPAAGARLFAVALQVRLAEAQGHTRLVVEGPGAPAWLGSLGPAPDPSALLADSALAGFVAAEGLAPLLAGTDWLATGRAVQEERRFAEAVRGLLQDEAPFAVDESWLEEPVSLNPEQRAAVRLAAVRRLAILTGGPGTGKTSIVAALVRAWRDAHPGGTFALAAPTGKAAQRLGEALAAAGVTAEASGGEPRTLHRLLGWRPRAAAWRHHKGNPLAADLVVVDEASMVDQGLLARLVDALRPGARLVLLGDADQLPSVGAGAVLRDLVAGLPEAVAQLVRSYRMDPSDPAGSAILGYAAKVREGSAEAADLPHRGRVEDLSGQGVELLDPVALPALLRHWRERIDGLDGYERLVHGEYAADDLGFGSAAVAGVRALLDHHDRFRLLALLQEGPRGAGALNAALHAQAWPLNGRGLRRDLPVYLGEPVMMTRNDYGRGLFNGDQGIVLKVRRGGELRREVVFWKGGRPEAHPLPALLGDLELAYALTVHKAQGSEFDALAVVLPEADHPLLTRQNLYTALTRARRHAVIVGDPALPPLAARKVERRATGLPELLSGPAQGRSR
ncbi:MAG TPA: AAA family ATPase [Holophagaceae bacterium]|nr:AAA family ATPase [Holophagaceae bacterium]